MLGIANYFWRLIPANPILLRVLDSGGKRRRDLFIRCGYLGLLVIFVAIAAVNAGTSLNELAQTSGQIFSRLSYLQLALVSLLAPIFTAGAITQEKDSQTYDILLCTPLSNGQIVLGSLLSRLFFVITLLISGIPVFSITQIFGGVAIDSIVTSFAIAASTAFITGALAMAIATFKVGTGRTIFSFYLFIVLFLVGGALLDRVDYFKVSLLDPVTKQSVDAVTGQPLVSQTSWVTPFNPFLALTTIVGENYKPPALGTLPEKLRAWPVGWMLTNPASFYTSLMFFLSLVMVTPSIVLLRRMAQSTVSFRGWVLQKLHLSTGDRNRKPRSVWMNPIAWREAKTKASAARATVLRYSFMIIGVVGAIVLAVMYSTAKPVGDGYKDYLTPESYNLDSRTLTIYNATDATVYRVSPGALVSYNGNQVDPGMIKGNVAVLDINVGKNNTLLGLTVADIPRRIKKDQVRQFLLAAIIVEFAVILLIVTNAAASTVTREKEDGTLDLLLTSPITSHYYIWGKLRGLVSFVVPLIAVPVLSVAVFVAFDLFREVTSRGGFEWIVFWEALLVVPAVLVIVSAFAAIMGMQMSLRCRTTVMAVMASVGIVCGACGAMGWCGYQSLNFSGAGTFNLFISGFSPFTVLTLLIDARTFGGRLIDSATPIDEVNGYRWTMFIAAWLSVAAYAGIVWTMYKSMVKNFDMTIRRQSR